MTPAPNPEQATCSNIPGMPPAAPPPPPPPSEGGPSRAAKFDQNKLEVIYTDNSPPKVDSNSPPKNDLLPDQEIKHEEEDHRAAAPPPPNTTALPKGPDTTTNLAKQQYDAFCQVKDLTKKATAALQQATYQSASIEIQTVLSMVQTRKDNITINDLDTLHKTFDTFMSSHPVLSKGYIEAKNAQIAAMVQLQSAPLPVPPPPLPPPRPLAEELEALLPPYSSQEQLLIDGLNLPFPQSLGDPPSIYLPRGADGGAAAVGGGTAAVGRLDLMQDVAAAYRYHNTQSSQTDTAEDLYINTLRNHLLDKANIDSAAVQVLQQLSTLTGDGGGGGGGAGASRGSGSGGRASRSNRAGGGSDPAAVFAEKSRLNKFRRGASHEDLAGSALISLGGGLTSQRDKEMEMFDQERPSRYGKRKNRGSDEVLDNRRSRSAPPYPSESNNTSSDHDGDQDVNYEYPKRRAK